MTEELVAYDAKVIVRLGTNDYNTTVREQRGEDKTTKPLLLLPLLLLFLLQLL